MGAGASCSIIDYNENRPDLEGLALGATYQNGSYCCTDTNSQGCNGLYPNGEFAKDGSGSGCDRLSNDPNRGCRGAGLGCNGGVCGGAFRGNNPKFKRIAYNADPLQCIFNVINGDGWKPFVRKDYGIYVTCDPDLKNTQSPLYIATMKAYCEGLTEVHYSDEARAPVDPAKPDDRPTTEPFYAAEPANRNNIWIPTSIVNENTAVTPQFQVPSTGVGDCHHFHNNVCRDFCSNSEYTTSCRDAFKNCCVSPESFNIDYNRSELNTVKPQGSGTVLNSCTSLIGSALGRDVTNDYMLAKVSGLCTETAFTYESNAPTVEVPNLLSPLCLNYCFNRPATLNTMNCDAAYKFFCNSKVEEIKDAYKINVVDNTIPNQAAAGSLAVSGAYDLVKMSDGSFTIRQSPYSDAVVATQMHAEYPVCDCFLPTDIYTSTLDSVTAVFPASQSLARFTQDAIKIPECSYIPCKNSQLYKPFNKRETCPNQLICVQSANIQFNGPNQQVTGNDINVDLSCKNELAEFGKLTNFDHTAFVPDLSDDLLQDNIVQMHSLSARGSMTVKFTVGIGPPDVPGASNNTGSTLVPLGVPGAPGSWPWYNVNPESVGLTQAAYDAYAVQTSDINTVNPFTTSGASAPWPTKLNLSVELRGVEVDYVIDPASGLGKPQPVGDTETTSARWFLGRLTFIKDADKSIAHLDIYETNEVMRDLNNELFPLENGTRHRVIVKKPVLNPNGSVTNTTEFKKFAPLVTGTRRFWMIEVDTTPHQDQAGDKIVSGTDKNGYESLAKTRVATTNMTRLTPAVAGVVSVTVVVIVGALLVLLLKSRRALLKL